ncbi:coagulation factor IX-like isoform X2 [Centruroides sculpturatus]|uniref:coagulation factor IX-like isoform X1 n=1 Tax=Centruroides sculpturatus TaxID=218467 RepID=UPI000C6DB1B5|nr:coagulation factor IX-like isoform X1 [Centruroides sculpturatus]XP_023211278.1 coagulation factor IX-like isoform X2 [Centruroides sculpturatus]
MMIEQGRNCSIVFLIATVIIMALLSVRGSRAIRHHFRHGKEYSQNLTIFAPQRMNYDQIYSKWTPWKKCSSRCKQVRSRLCKSPQHCGANVLREVRRCQGNRCRNKHKIVSGEEEIQERESDIRVLYHLQHFVYSDWSSWSPCTRTCRTHRYKTCEMALVCGNSLIQEDALCYVKNSICEKLYNKKKRREEKRRRRRRRKNEQELYDSALEESKKEDKYANVSKIGCGVAESNYGLSLKIIGGKNALKGKWPWQVIILDRYKTPYCGGTILSSEWILTAAHCVRRRRRLRIRAGELDLAKEEGKEQEIGVAEIHIHPAYDIHTVNNDIALLRLLHPLIFNEIIRPICLPTQGEELMLHSRVTIVGWGKRRNTAIYGSDLLQQAEVPIVDLDECRKVYKDYYISDNMLCAGFKRGGVDSCEGDSGGPLLFKKEGRWEIHGVTSFGEGCGRKGKYGIYAKVANFVKWIRKTIVRNGSNNERISS